ncbi:hypothetical protein M7I_3429 [Glarea lozoyensis 74030]|uniref:Fungal N-terminal domain-containing protein n=1 Tax=Glarea lozoyensis (strain ATCC 74030 / MF5533) TaxID=1104152 RepID=H0ELG5_GLAL7|nr:hypothetical protein M7I_3429 [Glarea lozoyensis 74030]
MSFGASLSDIIIVVTFCKTLYRKCRDASGEYDEISREVKALYTVLRHLKYELEAPESPLNRDRSIWGRQLAPIVRDYKVDAIAAKMSNQKSGSVMTSYDNDDKEVWKDFRRELVAEGFSSSVLQQHKDVLRAYIREIDQKVRHPSRQVSTLTSGWNQFSLKQPATRKLQ